jgi:FlaA1/EpsC-like NDP-sugar epimerase
MLHKLGKDETIPHYKLTDERMTRFVMTLEQSVNLIEHALLCAESGDVVIPKLVSCVVKDLIELFSEKYQKPIVVDKLRPGEKMLESLINNTQSLRICHGPDGYIYIKPPFKNVMSENSEEMDYNSKLNPLSKDELGHYLSNLNLI